MTERIYQMREYDLLRTTIKDGNMYACTDSRRLYQDVGNTRVVVDAIHLSTEKGRMNTTPQMNMKYYIWETSELWLWQNAWIKLIGNVDYPDAYQYDDGNLYAVGRIWS